jgi:hypothetical protein
MGSRLIIFSYIVGQRELCGMPSLPGLVFVGLCLVRSRSFWRVGGHVVDLEARLCGKWSLLVLCGVFGMSETINASRILRGLLRNSSTFFSLLFSPGQRVGWPRGCSVFLIFFLFFPLSLVPFVYPQCTKGCAPLRF